MSTLMRLRKRAQKAGNCGILGTFSTLISVHIVQATAKEITDYTTANGIPCVLCKVTDTEHGYVDVELYYTYDGVSYTVQCSVTTEEEADAVEEKMQALADSLVVGE